MFPSILIPARFQSSRFPGKPLALINGQPMIRLVAERCSMAFSKDNVIITSDNQGILDAVSDYKTILVRGDLKTGTDRVAKAAELLQINSDVIVNVQGDEPLVNPDDIRHLVETKIKNPNCVITGMCQIDSNEAKSEKNVKVVTNLAGCLLYASRSQVPHCHTITNCYNKQVGIYAYDKSQLFRFLSSDKTPLEYLEDIEILRFLEIGINVKMEKVSNTFSVDFPEDISIVEKLLC